MINRKLKLSLPLVVSVLLACGSGSNDDGLLSQGESCGASSASCKNGLYCAFPTGGCGTDGRFGTCEVIPEICTEIYAPVCGCDGKTYASACQAAGQMESVKAEGECPNTGNKVGAPTN